jgi:hypothetical protein
MALITRATSPSFDVNSAMYTANLPLIAGEALDIFSPCHVEADGLVYMSNGTLADADAIVLGFNVREVNAGEPVTLHGFGLRVSYGTGLTIGGKVYLAATDGRLDDAATTGDAVGIGTILTATDILFQRQP